VPIGPFHHRSDTKSTGQHFLAFFHFFSHLTAFASVSCRTISGSFCPISMNQVRQCRTFEDRVAYHGNDYRTDSQIVIKKGGAIVHREAETFDRKQRKEDPTLSAVIDRYIAESKNAVLGTKAQVLRTIKNSDLGDLKCSDITSQALVSFAKDLTQTVEPQTCANYFAHLSNIFTVAKPAWGYPISRQEFDDAVTVLKKLGLIRKGAERNRRPTLEELDRLMEHFGRIRDHRPSSIPMQKIVAFALFATRRQEEITLLRWEDLDGDRILVRDMKHPGDEKGNDVYCELPAEALAIIRSMPRTAPQIFPYSADAISAAFTRACQFLGIKDLRFHDLRHEGISRLFELARTIPQAAAVSGHRSWTSLKRYTHIRQTGDKYKNWTWLSVVSTEIQPI
jgi:integrase